VWKKEDMRAAVQKSELENKKAGDCSPAKIENQS